MFEMMDGMFKSYIQGFAEIRSEFLHDRSLGSCTVAGYPNVAVEVRMVLKLGVTHLTNFR